ncbi:UNVERIFIED_CONTAM: hypothetical protein Sradi_2770700 [Sesamum radiatum]|uniref:4Fe-4S ferredoxin-type domain-containing protein n=1 Tax=Sesamum radiatum TaxID=300843 RepID=A0AAW2S8X7_SESRA
MSLIFSCFASLPQQLPSEVHARSCISIGGIEKVKKLITRSGYLRPLPLHWIPSKRAIGLNSFAVLALRNLSLVYTLAGGAIIYFVDCIDCAAEASVVNAVNDGIEAARGIIPIRRPWVMISVNDNEDLHFRKAEFDPDDCPADCSRPCEHVCPADAISHSGKAGVSKGGVLAERCYGCGRCLPICPYDKIRAITYIRDVDAAAQLLKQDYVDAIEIHTSGRQAESFQQLWNGLGDSIDKLRLVAVSLPDMGELTVPAMNSMYATMKVNLQCLNLWQLDGRPMSGDIGRGFLQLAGGTNAHTVEGLKRERLFQTTSISEKSNGQKAPLNSFEPSHALISGVAFGGYARKIVGRVLRSLQSEHGYARLEDCPHHLLNAVIQALALVGTVKCYNER